MIITIDGPAGSGKSTAARNLARHLGVAFLDTGATYRAATLKALREQVDPEDEDALARLTRQADIHLEPGPDGLVVRLDGEDVSEPIRTPRVTDHAKYLARSPKVREVLVELQRRIGRELGSFVTEGRDQGSVVFPDADVKFYLDADPSQRARRRAEELRQKGQDADPDEVLQAIQQRDASDRNRAVGPLVCPDDAVVIDNSAMTPEQTLAALLDHVEDPCR